MLAFYVVKLLNDRGIYFPDTFILGDVEFRSPKSDLVEEKTTIKKSIKDNIDINEEVNCRIGTIIRANSLDEARLLADERFVNALDLISIDFPISNVSLTNYGYIKNLMTGELTPIENNIFLPNTAYIMGRGNFQIFQSSQWIALQNGELAIRYKRSLHWSRNGRWERNLQIRILFNWFAVEALFKESEDDDVGPFIRWFLGYPNGKSAKYVSPLLISKLKSDTLYEIWKSKIIYAIDAIRTFRNNSVHKGFRNVDCPVHELQFYNHIMTLGSSRCQGAAVAAVREGINTVTEFKQYISLIFENNANIVNDVHGNILSSLATGTYKHFNNIMYE